MLKYIHLHIQLQRTSNLNHILTMEKLNVILSIALIENIKTLQTHVNEEERDNHGLSNHGYMLRTLQYIRPNKTYGRPY